MSAMDDRWFIRVEVLPYSSGHGADYDQVRAGARTQTMIVSAPNVDAALRIAHVFADGIRTNPMVWQARVLEVREAAYGETARPHYGDPTDVKVVEDARRRPSPPVAVCAEA